MNQMVDQRSRLPRSLFLVFLSAVLILSTVFLPPLAMVEANGKDIEPNGAYWLLDFDFTGHQINASITVTTGYFMNQTMIYTNDVYTEDLVCTPVGGLTYHTEGIEFDGKSYIQCLFPDFRDIVYTMTEGNLILANQSPAFQPWIKGTYIIDGSSPGIAPMNIFHHPDLSLATNLNYGKPEANLEFTVDENRFSSSYYSYSGQMAGTSSTLMMMPNLMYELDFVGENGQQLLGSGPTLSKMPQINNGPATIYIGGSPSQAGPSNDNFRGIISTLTIDPPCIGSGI